MQIKTKYHPILVLYLMAFYHLNCLIVLLLLDFLLPHIPHFDNIVFLRLFIFETLGFIFSVSFLHFEQDDFIFINVFRHVIYYFEFLLII